MRPSCLEEPLFIKKAATYVAAALGLENSRFFAPVPRAMTDKSLMTTLSTVKTSPKWSFNGPIACFLLVIAA